MNHNDWLPFLRTIRRENMILRKRAGFLLFIALVILFSATSSAEYEQYRLTEPYELYTGQTCRDCSKADLCWLHCLHDRNPVLPDFSTILLTIYHSVLSSKQVLVWLC